MSEFVDFLAEVQDRVGGELTALLDAEMSRVSREAPELRALIGAVRDLTERGGKRVRAALVLLGHQAVSPVSDRAVALPAACAMELLQTYLLIHDDLIDRDDVRRGGPAVHAAMASHYQSRELGDQAAILAGDYAASLAQEALLRCPVPADALRAAFSTFATLQKDVVLGQCLDVLVEAPEGPLAPLVQRTHLWKTAAYTTTGPLCIGAALGGADARMLAALRAFGDPLGVAFQLRDDWLGTFGDPERTGKPNDSDLQQGKKTGVLAALEHEHAAALREYFAGGPRRVRGDDEVLAMRRRLEHAGAREALREAIERENAAAREALRRLELTPQTMRLFEGAMELIAERQT